MDLALVCGFRNDTPPGLNPAHVYTVLYRNIVGQFELSGAMPIEFGGAATPQAPTYCMAWGYVDGDSRPDAVITDMDELSGKLRVLRNTGFNASTGDIGFIDDTAMWFGPDGPDGVVSPKFVDFDNDGFLDLVLARTSRDNNLLLYRHTETGYQPVSGGLNTVREDLIDVSVADYDMNGWPDIMTVPTPEHGQTPPPRVFFNGLTEGGAFSEYRDLGMSAGPTAGTVAFDWLGNKPSVYLARPNTAAEPSGLFYSFTSLSDSLPAKYLRVRVAPHTGLVNSSAIGTKVTVVYEGQTQSRWILGGGGPGGQDPRVLVFPLGAGASTSASATTTWPGSDEVNLTSTWNIMSTLEPPPTQPNLWSTYTQSIVDIRTIGADAQSVRGSFEVGADSLWWIFEWDADCATWPEVDVELAPNQPADCDCIGPEYMTTIDPDTYNVEFELTQTAENVFHHRLTWKGWCCEVGCKLMFTARSRLNNKVVVVGEDVIAQSPRYICPVSP